MAMRSATISRGGQSDLIKWTFISTRCIFSLVFVEHKFAVIQSRYRQILYYGYIETKPTDMFILFMLTRLMTPKYYSEYLFCCKFWVRLS